MRGGNSSSVISNVFVLEGTGEALSSIDFLLLSVDPDVISDVAPLVGEIDADEGVLYSC